MTSEGELRRLRDSYAQGLIELEELERRVEDVVFGRWSPTSSMAAVLKEAWSDAPGGVMVYHPVATQDQLASQRDRLVALEGWYKRRLSS